MVRHLARLLAITALAIVAVTGSAQSQSTDTKDVQIARKKLRVGLDTAKYVTSTTHTVNSGSTHRMMPTAKAVYDAIIALGGGGGGGGGHIILDDDTAMDQRAGLNFISTPTVSAALTNDLPNDETEVRLTVPNDAITSNQIAANAVNNSELAANSVDSNKIAVRSISVFDIAQNGASNGQVLKWNGNMWIPSSDDTSGGAGGYSTIQEEGTGLTQRDKLNFIGSALTASDDAGNSRTNVNVDSDVNALANIATTGIYAVTASGSSAARTITPPAAGISITNGDGVSGNPTLALANDLSALEALSGNGFATRTGTDAWANRSISAGTGISITNGDGVSGNPTITNTQTAGHTIQEEGTGLTQRPNLNFVGAAFTAADDGANSRTNVSADSDVNALANISTTGIYAVTASGSSAARTITAPAAGISITNGNGVSGNPTLALANDLSALEGLSGSGIGVRTGVDTWANRSITNGAGISITNGDGVSGNPTITNTGDTDGTDDITTASSALGDVTGPFSNLQLGAGVVGNSELAANAVTNAKVNDVSVAKLTSGTVASGLTFTAANNSSINVNYNSGSVAFQLDDLSSAAGVYSEDGTQYVYADNTSTLIGSGTTNMQYIDGVLRLHDSDITNYVAIKTPATASLTANYTLTLPVDDGTAGQVLQTDGAGVLSWTTAGGGGFYQTARENGTARTQRGKYNFVNSTNTLATVVDDPANDESEVKFEIPAGGVTANEIATGAVNSGEITDGQVFSVDIADGTIVNNDVSAGSLNPNRLAQTGATTNQVLKWNDTEWVPGSTVIISDFTSSGTFTVDGAKAIDVICVGAGGGGGSGRKGANGGIRSGGGGGAGGGVAVGHFDIADLGNPTSITVTVGTGGAGGASQATNSTNGNAGGAGGNTSCSVSGTVFIQAAGGGGGAGGTNAGAAGGAISAFGDFQSQVGAASPGTGAAGVSPIDSWNKCGGSGGSGGGITAANATSSGGTGGKGYFTIMNGGAGGGAGVSGSFGDFVSLDRLTGGGGGGGGSKTTAGAAAGSGAAGAEGAGGGGGGAGTDSAANSGAGGAGGAGFVRIIARY